MQNKPTKNRSKKVDKQNRKICIIIKQGGREKDISIFNHKEKSKNIDEFSNFFGILEQWMKSFYK